MFRCIVCRCLLIGFLCLGVHQTSTAAPQAPTNQDCLECHSDQTLSKTNAAGQSLSLFVDEAKYVKSVHQTNSCVSCHSDVTAEHPDDNVVPQPVNCATCHAHQTETYQGSVHAQALQEGKAGAATCIDCHGTHDILPYTSPQSPLHYKRLATLCGECHNEITEQVQQSVHGKGIAQGHREAATCTDCHSEHKIEDLRKASPIKVAEQVCSKCHDSERINTKYHLPTDRVKTFLDSYHGLALQYGSVHAANCASCHGVHLILPSSDPRSSVHTNNLVQTCGKCHPGTTANFALAKVHVGDDYEGDLGGRINAWVRRIYLGLIFGTIGLMVIHNLLSWRHKVLASYYNPNRTVLRMDLSQRLQHLLLALSFVVLALTGFALKFPDSWLAWTVGSDEGVRRITHRVAGVVMLALGAYHVIYVIVTQSGRRLFKDFLPRRQDGRDFLTTVRHLVFHGQPRARFGRFNYAEKIEYWAVVWGTLIMGFTGLVIWMKISVTQFLPRWAVDVATTIHYYEAILACLAIVVWHFYHVMFDPEVYPLNWAFFDGRVPADWQHRDHPLDQPTAPKPATEIHAAPHDKTPHPDKPST